MHYLLFYDVAKDYLERRAQYRDRHLEDPADAAVLLFSGDSPEIVERFARADPYVTEGLVTQWRVRPWSTVVGSGAASPRRPESPKARA
jgi:uncharacterized protein YciI